MHGNHQKLERMKRDFWG